MKIERTAMYAVGDSKKRVRPIVAAPKEEDRMSDRRFVGNLV